MLVEGVYDLKQNGDGAAYQTQLAMTTRGWVACMIAGPTYEATLSAIFPPTIISSSHQCTAQMPPCCKEDMMYLQLLLI